MTPGISSIKSNINDQKYRTMDDVDTDYIIVGRALYNSQDIKNDIKLFINFL
jgi:orotidine-5'-phosphate decarboxylase